MPGKTKKSAISEKRLQNLERAIQSWNAGQQRVSHFPLVVYL